MTNSYPTRRSSELVDSEVTETSAAALDTLGKQIPLQPKQSASLGGDYTITSGALSGFGFGAGVRYVGEHFGDVANQWEAPSHTLFDASAHYDFSNWRLQLNVQNLADKEYVSTCNSADWCYYGYPRTRSEGHTSELQSLMRISYAVFCLKKK